MNIQSRKAIEANARQAAETKNDYCGYPHGSEHRQIWVDAYVTELAARERLGAMLSAKLKVAELV